MCANRSSLDNSIQYLKGIGEKKASLYKKIGIETIRDLLFYTPRRYINLCGELTIPALSTVDEGAVLGMVVQKNSGAMIRKGLTIFKVRIDDGEHTMTLTLYNTEYLVKSLEVGKWYVFYGNTAVENGKLTLRNISVLPETSKGKLYPIYPATAGLSSKTITKDIQMAIYLSSQYIETVVPSDLEEHLELPSLYDAIVSLHSPVIECTLEQALNRIAIEEILPFCMALLLSRTENKNFTNKLTAPNMSVFWDKIPFIPTQSQLDAIADILGDLCDKGQCMNRLVQGDVGSGKTIVAVAAAFIVSSCGYQCSLMAPTEVLATQHFEGLASIMEALGIRTALITGSTPIKEKREIKKLLANGDIKFIIGTHALLTEDVKFHNLRMVITDEQHRFGVAQRSKLLTKGTGVHTLVMSATPIPRTLSLLVFGDLDVSAMQTVPKGRLPIKTYLVNGAKRQRSYNFIKHHLDMGHQGYIVCTRVEDGEDDDRLLSATKLYNDLRIGHFAGYSVGLLTGQMKAKDKDKVMADFRKGDIQLLIATSVIEVGVDVPNAVIMVIENAERFGLSQLHQLRGRVGRGSTQSHCILISDSYSDVTKERLGLLANSTDGFEIAQMDLKLRGPGDFIGRRQHGLPTLQLSSKLRDESIPEEIRNYCNFIIDNDKELKNPEHKFLKEQTNKLLTILRNTKN